MKRLEKIIREFLRNPPEADFSDVEFLLEQFDFTRDRQKGSHVIFKGRPGSQPPIIIIPLVGGRKVKRHYVKRLVMLLELEIRHEEPREKS